MMSVTPVMYSAMLIQYSQKWSVELIWQSCSRYKQD